MPIVRHPRSDWEIHREWLYGASGPFGWPIGGRGIIGTPTPVPTGPVVVPNVIGEVPETWEELHELEPELFEPILETRPGQIADHYIDTGPVEWWVDRAGSAVGEAPQPVGDDELDHEHDEEDSMAHDWGHLIRQGIGSITGISEGVATGSGQLVSGTDYTAPVGTGTVLAHQNGGDCDGMQWGGGAPPKGYKVVNSCGVGVLRKVRRRRRRRLLTASDSRDIATIVGLVGKGQMASALINRR